ncbi:MAG: D-alanyl-D-alanine carboxypeptidase family protein [Alphaproteobacteria bacterium]
MLLNCLFGLRRRAGRFLLPLLLLAAACAALPLQARAIDTEAQEAFMVDFDTGAVLLEKNPDQLMHPSSMSKMMTVYLLFERLKNGSVKLDDEFPVSEKAWRMGGSKMFVPLGGKIRVEDLIRGIVIQSGNDACIVVAEGLGGNEEAFAAEMTRRAHELGMTNSTFKNATGWPDPDHLTTARDLALLAKRTITDFPEYYHYYGELEFTFNKIKQGNRNPLLYKDMGADGLKTGHTEQGGYGVTASAKRGDRRLILVVNGLPSMKERAAESERLMEWGFREFDNYSLFKAGDTVTDADVWLGDAATVPLAIGSDLKVTLPKKSRHDMKVKAVFDGPIPAPIKKGDQIAKLVIAAPDMAPMEVPLVAGADIGRLGFVGRIGAAIKHIVWGSVQ